MWNNTPPCMISALAACLVLTLCAHGCGNRNDGNRNDHQPDDSALRGVEAVRARAAIHRFHEAIDKYLREPNPRGSKSFAVKVLIGENDELLPIWIELDLDFEQSKVFVGKIIDVPENWELMRPGQPIRQEPEFIVDWRIITPQGTRLGSRETTN